MPNFGYHLARLEGSCCRSLYHRSLSLIVNRPIAAPRSLSFEVFSYSGEAGLPEQVASIRSFLRHVGRPTNFTVVSDGSHSSPSVRLLEKIDSSVRVQMSIPPPAPELPPRFRHYLTNHATGKQLALMMSLPTSQPTLYLDSDVLFFAGATDLVRRAAEKNVPAYYLADCQFSGDPRLLHDSRERNGPVNTGALLLFKKPDWSFARERFLQLNGEPTFFTNQTLAHLVMHEAGELPLDPAKYVLQLDDQFIYSDRYANPNLALRHYVNPIRHKFWTNLIH